MDKFMLTSFTALRWCLSTQQQGQDRETGIYSCIRCQFRGTEEEVLQGNEDVRKKYKAMYKRFDKFDFD